MLLLQLSKSVTDGFLGNLGLLILQTCFHELVKDARCRSTVRIENVIYNFAILWSPIRVIDISLSQSPKQYSL